MILLLIPKNTALHPLWPSENEKLTARPSVAGHQQLHLHPWENIPIYIKSNMLESTVKIALLSDGYPPIRTVITHSRFSQEESDRNSAISNH